MVMALARGITLDRLLRSEGPLPPVIVERLLFPLLDGLEKVHRTGFLHSDIKPGNIIVDARGSPILIDFGAARAAIASGSAPPTAIFTPGFAAAEPFTSSTLGPPTDI
jgi:serine/threonine protein kinase